MPAIDYFREPVTPTNVPVAGGNSAYPTYSPPDNNAATLKAPTSIRLILSNGAQGITIEGVDGAIIGRRNGIYQSQFARFPYISGTHAKLKFDAVQNKWFITDMNSSNGTRYNNVPLVAGQPCVLENGATVQLANIVLTIALY